MKGDEVVNPTIYEPIDINELIEQLEELGYEHIEPKSSRTLVIRTPDNRNVLLDRLTKEFEEDGAVRIPGYAMGSSTGGIKIGRIGIVAKPDTAKGKADTGGAERQERGLIDAINKHPGLTIAGLGENITGAQKSDRPHAEGKEPYVDVDIFRGDEMIGISCKGTAAPSLAGGGIPGIAEAAVDLLPAAADAVAEWLKHEGYQQDQIVDASDIPDFFVLIPETYMDQILRGSEKIGGPVDFMYIGPMDVTANVVGDELVLNGEFISVDDYMEQIGDFYLRIRKRDLARNGKIQLDFERGDRRFPKLYKDPATGKTNSRVVVTGKAASVSPILSIDPQINII